MPLFATADPNPGRSPLVRPPTTPSFDPIASFISEHCGSNLAVSDTMRARSGRPKAERRLLRCVAALGGTIHAASCRGVRRDT